MPLQGWMNYAATVTRSKAAASLDRLTSLTELLLVVVAPAGLMLELAPLPAVPVAPAGLEEESYGSPQPRLHEPTDRP